MHPQFIHRVAAEKHATLSIIPVHRSSSGSGKVPPAISAKTTPAPCYSDEWRAFNAALNKENSFTLAEHRSFTVLRHRSALEHLTS